MSAFFYVLGAVIVFLGAGWCFLILGQPTTQAIGQYASAATFGRMLALIPGMSAIGSGLLFLAIGGILNRLDRIARNTADAAASFGEASEFPVPFRERHEPHG